MTSTTLLRWHRELIARNYDGSEKRRPGRPRTAVEIQKLVVRMAGENPRWGCTRIRGALSNLGHEIGRNTIKRILLDNGFDAMRKKGMSWTTILKAHWGAVAATDFFSVEAVTEYTEHYHAERNHQGIGNGLIDDQRSTISIIGDIEPRERLGGMLNYYHRRAA